LLWDTNGGTRSYKGKDIDLSFWWSVGASARPDYDYKLGVSNWNEAFSQIGEIRKTKYIQWIEFWGHGSPGKAYLGNEELNLEKFKDLCKTYGIVAADFRRKTWCTPLFWFRTCVTAQGDEGKAFLVGIANELDVYAYGHDQNIDFHHNGICCACRRNGDYLTNFVTVPKTLAAVYPEGIW